MHPQLLEWYVDAELSDFGDQQKTNWTESYRYNAMCTYWYCVCQWQVEMVIGSWVPLIPHVPLYESPRLKTAESKFSNS